MTLILIFSLFIRMGFLIFRLYVGTEFDEFIDRSGKGDTWIMPVYFVAHYIFVDFFSLGSLLLSFAFALSNNTKVI
jgi:hypothetical protein